MMACAHSCLLPPFPFSSTLAVATSRVRAIKSLFGRVYVTATSALASSEGGARARAVASMSARAPGATTPDGARKPVGLLVLSGPGAPELKYLERLPPSVRIVAVGQRLEEFSHLSAEGWASVECMLNCGVLENAAKRETIEGVWPRVPNLHWFHLASAGIEHVVFPALVASDVVLTNAKGCFSHSLAEYALFGCKYFALDYPRMAAAKRQSQWAPYDVEELREKRMGIVGYGDIGQAVARIARAFRMKVVGLRRRKELSAEEEKEGLVEKMYGTDQLIEMVGECDYVVMATPFTPATHKMFSREAVAAMKPNAVFVNIGRGKCVDEDALVEALEARKIRGAVLDVTYTEPLPKDHKLWTLPNVVLSPHCSADRTDQFQFDAMDLFVRNAHRYVAGESVLNVVDKAAGY